MAFCATLSILHAALVVFRWRITYCPGLLFKACRYCTICVTYALVACVLVPRYKTKLSCNGNYDSTSCLNSERLTALDTYYLVTLLLLSSSLAVRQWFIDGALLLGALELCAVLGGVSYSWLLQVFFATGVLIHSYGSEFNSR